MKTIRTLRRTLAEFLLSGGRLGWLEPGDGSVNDDWTAVTAATTLEFGSAAIATTGAIEGDRIHYLAQAPAVDDPPSHLDASLHEYLGRTLIVTVPLDPSP